jgi:WD40 repeat protein
MASASLRRRVRSIALHLALPVLLLAPASAQAAPAPGPSAAGLHVDVLSCVTGNTNVAAQQGCRKAPGAGYEGSQSSGLDEVLALATAGDRTAIYAVGGRNSSLAQLALDRPSGAISFISCLTGDKFVDDCTQLPGATSNAPEAPVSHPTAAAISPDGRSLYLVSGDFHASVVARFSRDPLSGALAYEGCLTGDLGAGPAGPAGCLALPGATREGFGSGLYEASGVAVSADGRRVYVTAAGDGSVAVFDRDPAGGLSFLECVSSNPRASGCVRTPGGNDVLEGLGAPVFSPDGRYLYAAASRDGTVVAFALGGTDTIRFAGCVTARDDAKPCRPGRHPDGPVAALSNPTDIAGSADGRFLYVSSTYGTIVALKRNRASGALSAVSCVSSEAEDRGRCTGVPAIRRTRGAHHASLLTGVRAPLLSANGKTILAPVRTIDGIARFHRNPKSGALSFRGCATGNLQLSTARKGPCQPLPNATRNGTDSGFYKTTALIPAPGGLLYAAASGDATVSLLRP